MAVRSVTVRCMVQGEVDNCAGSLQRGIFWSLGRIDGPFVVGVVPLVRISATSTLVAAVNATVMSSILSSSMCRRTLVLLI